MNWTIVLLAENLLPTDHLPRKEAPHSPATFTQVSSLATKVPVRKIEPVLQKRHCASAHGENDFV
jgi:hypothetical protein